MITPDVRAEIRRLVLVDHWKIETAARRFGVHHSVVRCAIRSEATSGTSKTPPVSQLDPYKPFIVERLTALPELTGIRLLQEVRARGYAGGIAQLRRYVARVRTPRQRKAYLRVEVEAGEQAQVDWGSFGMIRVDGTQRPLSCFAMVLSWSRALYIDFSLDQRMETFLRMHERAFHYFGGLPRRVLYDNLKSVVLHHIGSTVQFNPRFLHYAGHQLFEPVACPVRYPEAKGRVENAIRYIRQSFFYGRSYSSLEDLRTQAQRWCDEVANRRVHATTRERPEERLVLERTRLRSRPVHPFDTDLTLTTIVTKEARILLDTNAYSVPHALVGELVQVRADDQRVRVIDAAGNVVIEHKRSYGRRQSIENRDHVDALLKRRPGAQGPRRRDRLAALAPACRLYLQEIARRPIDLECEVRKLLRLLDRYGQDDLVAGMTNALAQGSFGARYVRALMDQARFDRGLGEPPEVVVTGNRNADDVVVVPHDLGGYDELF